MCIFVDVSIPGGINVIKKEAEKILTYNDLIIENQCMWNVKIKSDTGNNRGDRNQIAQFPSRCLYVNNVLIKPSLRNNIMTVAVYCYSCLAKQPVSALLGHCRAYKTVVLVKVHSVVFTYGIPWFTVLLRAFVELQVLFKKTL
jgi:hypothetical protein